ncbi:hypothetical protein EVA_19286 [gut metagenome]|uniref:Uncharacterized protein n=1 Tax=gut metagenome TaxID=749906 RepID=J9BYI3_9ZZZZ
MELSPGLTVTGKVRTAQSLTFKFSQSPVYRCRCYIVRRYIVVIAVTSPPPWVTFPLVDRLPSSRAPGSPLLVPAACPTP